MSSVRYSADVGDEVPNFNLDSNMGRIAFHEMIDGKWCLLVTFTTAFEPVATTDIGMLAKLAEEFEARNVMVLIVGNDTGSILNSTLNKVIIPHYNVNLKLVCM
jgi:thioredoxin-dependent peroxiredoxin